MKQFTLKVFGLLALLCTFGLLQAQKTETVKPTADPLAELTNSPEGYDAAKAEWVATHPEAYAEMNQTTLPAVEKTAPWGADDNKDRWISEHPREYAEMTATKVETRTILTKEQLSTFPAEKQASILKDANFIIIE